MKINAEVLRWAQLAMICDDWQSLVEDDGGNGDDDVLSSEGTGL